MKGRLFLVTKTQWTRQLTYECIRVVLHPFYWDARHIPRFFQEVFDEVVLSSLTGLFCLKDRRPTVETVGYYRLSLRDMKRLVI